MGFYRIIKRTIKYILFQMPKRWLIMIIFALVMLLGLTKVQAYEYVSQSDVEFLAYIDLNSHSFNTGVHINSNSDTNCSFQLAFSTENTGQYNYIYLQGSSVSSYPSDITQKDMCGLFVNNSTNTQFFYNNVRYWDGAMNMSANTKYYIRQDKNVLYKPNSSDSNFVVANTFSSNFNNNNGYTFIIAPRAKAVTFKVYDFIIYNSSNGVLGESYHFYPAKYGSKYGFYESIGSNFYEINGVTGGGVNPNPPFVLPSITTSQADIQNWSFDNLLINGGSMNWTTQYGLPIYYLIVDYNGHREYIPIREYGTFSQSTGLIFTIPKSVLVDNSAIVSGRTIDFGLHYTYPIAEDTENASNWEHVTYDLDIYTLSLTQTEQDNINKDQEISSINNLNNSINDLNNTQSQTNDILTDSNVDSNAVWTPTVPTDESGVYNGLNNIFDVIMIAFTHFDPTQDVVLPFPFTNKSITISGDYTRTMLTNSNSSWVINFITLFWWYIISVYIVLDILKIVDKIQTGKLDQVEDSNIKGDML